MAKRSRSNTEEILRAALDEGKRSPVLLLLLRDAAAELKRLHPYSRECAVCTELLPLLSGITAHMNIEQCPIYGSSGIRCSLSEGHAGGHAHAI